MYRKEKFRRGETACQANRLIRRRCKRYITYNLKRYITFILYIKGKQNKYKTLDLSGILVIQHNCRKAYSITIAAIETGIQLNAAFICLQEPYIGINFFSHSGYDLRWPEKGKKKEKRVLIAIKRDILNRVATEVRSDLVNHPYFLIINIWELHL
jgi:hypothetical protein